MPVPIRRFHIQKINEYVKKKEEEAEEQDGVTRLSSKNNPMSNIPKEALPGAKKPTYSTNIKPKK